MSRREQGLLDALPDDVLDRVAWLWVEAVREAEHPPR
jgi:hypothetical protein